MSQQTKTWVRLRFQDIKGLFLWWTGAPHRRFRNCARRISEMKIGRKKLSEKEAAELEKLLEFEVPIPFLTPNLIYDFFGHGKNSPCFILVKP